MNFRFLLLLPLFLSPLYWHISDIESFWWNTSLGILSYVSSFIFIIYTLFYAEFYYKKLNNLGNGYYYNFNDKLCTLHIFKIKWYFFKSYRCIKYFTVSGVLDEMSTSSKKIPKRTELIKVISDVIIEHENKLESKVDLNNISRHEVNIGYEPDQMNKLL